MFCRIIKFIFSFCRDFNIKEPAVLKNHVHSCESCREYCAQRDHIAKALSVSGETEAFPESLHLKIMEDIKRQPRPERIQNHSHSFKYLYAFGSAAAVIILIAVVFVFHMQKRAATDAMKQEIAQYRDILQPEEQITGYVNNQVVNPMNSELELLKSDLIQTGEFFLSKLKVNEVAENETDSKL